jgi:predicted aldo/keto reductase-like oxidoreductase
MSDDYGRAFRYALSQPGVACALIGAQTPAEVIRAAQAAREFRPLSEEEMAGAVRFGEEIVETKSSKAKILNQHRNHDYREDRYA